MPRRTVRASDAFVSLKSSAPLPTVHGPGGVIDDLSEKRVVPEHDDISQFEFKA
jgi:hypothetical protein